MAKHILDLDELNEAAAGLYFRDVLRADLIQFRKNYFANITKMFAANEITVVGIKDVGDTEYGSANFKGVEITITYKKNKFILKMSNTGATFELCGVDGKPLEYKQQTSINKFLESLNKFVK